MLRFLPWPAAAASFLPSSSAASARRRPRRRGPVRDRKTSSSVGRCRAMSASPISRLVEPADALEQRGRPLAAHGDAHRAFVLVDVGLAGPDARRGLRRRASMSARSSTCSSSTSPPIWSFSSSDVPSAITVPDVDDGDLVGELVGLLEVLRGEQQRGAFALQLADELPHVDAGCAGRARSWARRGTARRAGPPGWRPGRAVGACRPSRSSPGDPRHRTGRTARAPRRRGAAPRPWRGGRAGRPARGSRAR